MQEMMTIYKTGESHLQTTVDENGLCTFSGINRENGKDFTVPEYLKFLGPGFVCIPLDDAYEQIEVVNENNYIKPWEQITEEQWDDALNVLPPMNWRTVDGVNFFQCSERMTSNITATYAAVNNKHFTAYRRTSQPYSELVSEIREII